jgi:hypothetical protein
MTSPFHDLNFSLSIIKDNRSQSGPRGADAGAARHVPRGSPGGVPGQPRGGTGEKPDEAPCSRAGRRASPRPATLLEGAAPRSRLSRPARVRAAHARRLSAESEIGVCAPNRRAGQLPRAPLMVVVWQLPFPSRFISAQPTPACWCWTTADDDANDNNKGGNGEHLRVRGVD